MLNSNKTGLEIAIIGMSGKFPGANDIYEFWNNQKNGIESIAFFSEDELIKAGVAASTLENTNYIKSFGALDGGEYFDSAFFDYTPNEGELMDPQIRLFHECAWIALEHAGYSSNSYDGLIGVYAGASSNFKWEARSFLSEASNSVGSYGSSFLSDKDFISLKVAYKLDFKGPAVELSTACSTSLVAVHLACQALLNGECDIALAGGVSFARMKKEGGYTYQEGMVMSKDGHCRAFDENANGTTGGEGVAVVVLKRLDDAIMDRDTIHAIIKGSAINNDGIGKIGFTAPSIEGQAKVIKTALHLAEVEPESISYIETHGTGTTLGDPVEIEGLKLAFNTNKKQLCRIGSVKTNVGHLDVAAGITGLIKTVMALKNKLIPPSLHFENANSKIDFDNSPFYVNNKLVELKSEKYPLRAGISSFGIGGTNAHMIIEEAPKRSNHYGGVPKNNRNCQVIMLSAKTETALTGITENLLLYLKENPFINLADVAYTLHLGRKKFQHRKMFICSEVNEAIDLLSGKGESIQTYISENDDEVNPSIFMFPGQGSQYVNMCRGLYKNELKFREVLEDCFRILNSLMDCDLKEIIFPSQSKDKIEYLQPRINQTEVAQPLIFSIEYVLAKLLIGWGIRPDAMIGHSIGEYVAACLSGVLSLEDALKLVTIRGKLMQQMPPGEMLSVPLSQNRLKPLLELHPGVELAAVNAPDLCVVSGNQVDIEEFNLKLKQNGFEGVRLHTSHAFHSRMMEPILKKFEANIKQIKFFPPQIPYISNLTGEWITFTEISNPHYWTNHLRNTVHFSNGIQKILMQREDSYTFIEIGPGRVLSSFVKKHLNEKTSRKHKIINAVRHPREPITDQSYLLEVIGQLWFYDKDVDWSEFYSNQERYRIPLPTYPFDKLYFPIDHDFFGKIRKLTDPSNKPLRKNKDMSKWFYVPSWIRSSIAANSLNAFSDDSFWLIFTKNEEGNLEQKLLDKLSKMGQGFIEVNIGSSFIKINETKYMIDPQNKGDYENLFDDLKKSQQIPEKIIHLWNISYTKNKSDILGNLNRSQDIGFFSLLNIVQAVFRNQITSPIQLEVITSNMQEVIGGDLFYPEKSTIMGAVKVIPLEYNNIRCHCIDIETPVFRSQHEDDLISKLLEEITLVSHDNSKVTAYRGSHRWVQNITPIRLNGSKEILHRVKKHGVYLITGGLGGMGFTIAQHLGKDFNARLVLLGRSFFPTRNNWQKWLEEHDNNDPISLKIRKIILLEEDGAEVTIIQADVSDEIRMKKVIKQIQDRFGQINGILHAAGIADYAGVIHKRTKKMSEVPMAPKVKGTLVLSKLTINMDLDFFVLFSSIGNYLYGIKFGEVGYCAANEFLEAFVHFRNNEKSTFIVSISWNDWQDVGMSYKAVTGDGAKSGNNNKGILSGGITPTEGVEVLYRILGNKLPQVIVSTMDLDKMMKKLNTADRPFSSKNKELTKSRVTYSRPKLKTDYAEPENDIERMLSKILSNYLGINQVGIHDNFFDLGANSMDMIQINAKIKKILKKDIPVISLYTYSTIKSLCQFINQENNTQSVKNEISDIKKERKKGKNKLSKRKSKIIDSF